MMSADRLFLTTIRDAMATSTTMEMGVSVFVKIEGLSPNPRDFQISAEKLSRKSRNAVSSAYDKISNTKPGAKVLINVNRSAPVMGWRLVLSASSSGDGGGSLLSSHRKRSSGRKNRQDETNGIQNSVTPRSRMTRPPTVFPNPAEKIK